MRLKASAAAKPPFSPCSARRSVTRRLNSMTSRCRHGPRAPRRPRSPSSSAAGSCARGAPQAWLDELGHVLEVIRLVGLEQEQRRRPVGRDRRARGRTADRVRRRSRRSRETRRCGDPGAAGTSSTGRDPRRRSGLSRRIEDATSKRWRRPDSSSPSGQPRKITSPLPPRATDAARCSWRRVTTSSAGSCAGSQVPLDPSVQMRWKISHPLAAHFASVPPQPNSTSSGCAPTASARWGREGWTPSGQVATLASAKSSGRSMSIASLRS